MLRYLSCGQSSSTCPKLTVHTVLIIGSKTEPSIGVIFEARLLTKCTDDVNEWRKDTKTSQDLANTELINDQAAPRILLRNQALSIVRSGSRSALLSESPTSFEYRKFP